MHVPQFLSHVQVAVVVNHTYPVRWMGRQAVVALPEHIDVSNASQIREELLWLINRGAAALIADMSCSYVKLRARVARRLPRCQPAASGRRCRIGGV